MVSNLEVGTVAAAVAQSLSYVPVLANLLQRLLETLLLNFPSFVFGYFAGEDCFDKQTENHSGLSDIL